MKYKVGDKVRVISILKAGEKYGDKKFTKCMEKYRGEVVTISKVYCNRYCIKEDYEGWYWTDEMFEGLAEDKLTAEEAIKIQAEMCRGIVCKDCAIDRLRYDSHCECAEYRSKNPDKVLEIIKQWKKDHEKKEVEVEFACIVRVIEDTGSRRRCVYEEDVTEVKDETFKMSMKRILEEYCKEHDGKFFTVYEEICRVKE
jgi:hypothetical protein